MNAKEFFDKVSAMRAAQKGFFSTAKGTQEHGRYYAESKRLEEEIDAEIERVNNIMSSNNG